MADRTLSRAAALTRHDAAYFPVQPGAWCGGCVNGWVYVERGDDDMLDRCPCAAGADGPPVDPAECGDDPWEPGTAA